jgi:uncharacterized protein YjiS (DUF1127 family)
MPSLSKAPLLARPHRDYIRTRKTKGDFQMGIRKTLRKWAAYQQTVRELAALDNRQLNDLGITRNDITRIARDHASTL